MKNKFLSVISSLVALMAAQTAFAHIQEFAWNDNGDNTITFFGSSYHGSLGSATGSGLVLDGQAFNYTSFTSISDAGFNALLGTLDGVHVIENFSAVNGYGSFTLSAADIAGLGWTYGANAVTASVFSSGAEFIDVHGNGTPYSIVVNVSSVPESGATMSLLGLALLGFGLARRKLASA